MVSVGERGAAGDTHSLRQVCHTCNRGNLSVSMATPFAFSTHMAGRQSPEQGRLLTQNNNTASCRCKSGDEEGPEAHSQSRWTARLPTARLPFCGGGRKKPVSVQRAAGFPSRKKRGQITHNRYQTRLQELPTVTDHWEEKGLCPGSL